VVIDTILGLLLAAVWCSGYIAVLSSSHKTGLVAFGAFMLVFIAWAASYAEPGVITTFMEMSAAFMGVMCICAGITGDNNS